jgi:hypothetical protein
MANARGVSASCTIASFSDAWPGRLTRRCVSSWPRQSARRPASRSGVRAVYKGQPDEPGEEIDACELVARVLAKVPDPKRHVVHYYGAYSNVARGKRKNACVGLQAADEAEDPEEMSPEQAARRRSWAGLIRRVYEVDPLICPRCGGEMRVDALITDPPVIKRILDHLARRDRAARAPPSSHPAVA